MAKTPEGYMENSQGHLVPLGLVPEIDQARNDLVCEIITKAKDLSGVLAKFKIEVMGDIEAFVSLSAEKYGLSVGGKKGNVQLVSYNGKYKVMRAVNERITFDERLQVAKDLIDECLQDWSQGSRDEIKALINDAFYVDKQGKINTNRILGLRRLDIVDKRWGQAMNAISESIQVSGTKSYVRIYERREDGSYQQINLDLAAI